MPTGGLQFELAAVLKGHPELGLDEAEIRLVTLVLTAFASSPPVVRLAVAPKIMDMARTALEIMRGGSRPAKVGGDGEQWD